MTRARGASGLAEGANPDAAIEAVCRLAADYYSKQPISEVDLLFASGYRENREIITVHDIEACLRQHPSWTEAWMDLSDDQRVSEGWYIAQVDGGCVLGRIPAGPKTQFDDCTVACAEFVKRFAEDLADWTIRGMLLQAAGWFINGIREEIRRRKRP